MNSDLDESDSDDSDADIGLLASLRRPQRLVQALLTPFWKRVYQDTPQSEPVRPLLPESSEPSEEPPRAPLYRRHLRGSRSQPSDELMQAPSYRRNLQRSRSLSPRAGSPPPKPRRRASAAAEVVDRRVARVHLTPKEPVADERVVDEAVAEGPGADEALAKLVPKSPARGSARQRVTRVHKMSNDREPAIASIEIESPTPKSARAESPKRSGSPQPAGGRSAGARSAGAKSASAKSPVARPARRKSVLAEESKAGEADESPGVSRSSPTRRKRVSVAEESSGGETPANRRVQKVIVTRGRARKHSTQTPAHTPPETSSVLQPAQKKVRRKGDEGASAPSTPAKVDDRRPRKRSKKD
ncbi:hypothetical protein GNI_171020 [Gregarina niphandrodes]|uniref:Uncharacterized protein n=1 Tax=Gregarina niphandrodes TaxID=110365 RepID=A0A023AYV9_GRENI|nr:hypothetical protein GNI_171020 [Gregarina niphandrodes]EZG43460.1 hypothetical protein GNI_171020 [Gregarina niphandrodes]|eukprot:XP_011133311.1 hypothetical protein GNI_171020 [Gregarina niphandrodes]